MKVLLVHPEFPITYWGFQYSLAFTKARAMLPPLGLITVAAMLPDDWELRLADLNVRPLSDAEITWADAVLIGGMRVQLDGMHEVIRRARALGVRVVVGGPAPTTSPSELADADLIVQGEIEGRVPELIAALTAPRGEIRRMEKSDPPPALTQSPIPRFDLLRLADYDTVSVQVSRGCPFRCEFCDIIAIYGRVPRVKAPEQVIAELEALYDLGWRGGIFVVDDNLIGNRRAVRVLLPEIIAFQRRHGYPFDMSTEASIDLAADDKLVADLVAAGFSQVFIGIETPSTEALRAAKKTQNLKVDPAVAVDTLTRAGLEVMAGFIVGFDQDGPEAFEAQRAFIQSAPIPKAMVGLLMALPETALWRRLAKEGRLRTHGSGDQFGRPNFEPALDEETLLSGYASLLAALYEPKAYYARCEALASKVGPVPGPFRFRLRDLLRVLQVIWVFGIKRSSRRHFWRLILRTLRRSPRNLRRAVVLAVMGEHMIRYTREDVLPRLEAALRDVRAARAEPIALEAPIQSPAAAVGSWSGLRAEA